MDKKKIDIQENIIDTENFLPGEKSEPVKITYKASAEEKTSRKSRAAEDAEIKEFEQEDFFDKKRIQKKEKKKKRK